MNKYEQLIEYIINEQEDKARELFHQIVVEKSREIYESLIDEEDFSEAIGGDAVGGLADELEADETDGLGGMGGEEPMSAMGGEEPMDAMGGEEPMDGDTEAPATKGDIADLQDMFHSEYERLDQEFQAIKAELNLGGEGAADEMPTDDMGGDDAAGDGEFGEPIGDEGGEEEEETKEDAMVREYVEQKGGKTYDKFSNASTEGQEVGAGGSVPVNKKPVHAGPNRMGGESKNILPGGSNPAPDGQRPNGKAGGFVKPAQEIDVAKRNVNKVGGNAGAQNFYSNKAKASGGNEGQTTDGKMSVDTKSLVGGKVR